MIDDRGPSSGEMIDDRGPSTINYQLSTINSLSGAVVLVGLSGSGKSTVGQLVATTLGVPYLDTDDVVAARAGKPVPQVFADEGEERFRDLETEVIVEHCRGVLHTPARLGHCVIATGGGAVLRPANRAALV